ncbi:MAG: transposase [Methanosarcinaceae archaeon]
MRMRVEPIKIKDFVHVFNRGNRKAIIFRDTNDWWRFLKILFFFNHQDSLSNLSRKGMFEGVFGVRPRTLQRGKFKWPEWPKDWGPRKPLVKILAYCLKDNHFHLLLQEIMKGGISKFMQKLGDGFTVYSNLKYDEVGRVFQGSYRGKTITDDIRNLQYMDAYIQVFNPFENYPGGIEQAGQEFDKAFEVAMNNPFTSLGESLGRRNLGIIDRDILKDMYPDLEAYKEFARDALLVRNMREILGKSTME